jgi:hypothetical protein
MAAILLILFLFAGGDARELNTNVGVAAVTKRRLGGGDDRSAADLGGVAWFTGEHLARASWDVRSDPE